jgi:hypothetical protein
METEPRSEASGEASVFQLKTAEDYRRVLECSRAEGVSLAEFARRHGLRAKRLYRLGERLRQQGKLGDGGAETSFVPAVVVQCASKEKRGTGPMPPHFPPPPAPGALDSGVEVVVRGGGRVRVHAGFDVSTLVRVVAALGGEAC